MTEAGRVEQTEQSEVRGGLTARAGGDRRRRAGRADGGVRAGRARRGGDGAGEGRAARRDRAHRGLQGLPLRHRRPSLLHEGARGEPAVAAVARAGVPAPAAPEPHLLRRPVLPLSAARLQRAVRAGAVAERAILASYVHARLRPSPVEDTFEQWVSNRFGRRLYEIFFKTYTEKVWGIPCSEIRAEWAAQRIKGLSLPAAIRNAILPPRGEVIKTLIEAFDYPRRGPGQMWERVRDAGARGGPARRLRDRRRRGCAIATAAVTEVVSRTSAGDTAWPATHVISSMPLQELILKLEPAPPAPIVAAAPPAGLPRLRHRRPHPRSRDAVHRQLDLRAQRRRAGRPHPELQELEPGDGAGSTQHQPRPRVLLPGGRRPLDDARRRADRARRPRARGHRPGPGRRRARRRGGAAAEGVSDLRRRVRRLSRDHQGVARRPRRTCRPSGATACTSTTTRTTRC